MNAPLFLSLNLAVLAVIITAGIVLRFWLRRLPDPQGARRKIFSVFMWLGCLICIAAFALRLVSKDAQPLWLLTSTGLLIVVSMMLARRGTQPK